MGNKARKGGRDTAFYQVLNVSEGWHRNRALTKKEDQKLLRTKEMLAEQLDGKGYVAVEFYDDGSGPAPTSFRVKVNEKDPVLALREKVCEHLECGGDQIELMVEGKVMNMKDRICDAFSRAYAKEKMSYPKPYLGIVWACPV
ncbi:hypothetical protein TeGR_g14563 [Tetraparma gracilis]|uniref:Uncharacterized protein n=1 Tax=Tetraparma gracilis TaxID=2962635 RepID=A0ABQ6M9W8_9STRA|nr:hypothetical protein TeGR_g14563 [Tetraparma gracilis]